MAPSVPAMAPDQVFFGLTAGISFGPPKARPAKYPSTSVAPHHREQQHHREKPMDVIVAQQHRREQHGTGIADPRGNPQPPFARRENQGGENAQADQQDRRHGAA